MLLTGLLSGCSQEQTADIQWQLPLEAPQDPHGAEQGQTPLPAWSAENKGVAQLMLLQASTARHWVVDLASDTTVDLADWHFTLLGMAEGLRLQSGAFIEDQNVHNAAAFVEVRYHEQLIYRGWLYQEFPELFGPDIPDWKLWLKHITVRASSEDATETGSLSSAG